MRRALILVVLAAACAAPESGPLVVTQRLIDWSMPPPPPGTPRECAIGDEIRPALGCLPSLLIEPLNGALVEDGGVRREVAVPGGAGAGPFIVELQWTVPHGRAWTALAPEMLGPRERVALTWKPPVEPGGRVDVRAFLRPLPPLPRSKTAPVAVARGAVLRGGFGLDPLSRPLGLSPARFRVTARTDGGSQVLLDRVLDPATPAAAAWADYEIDLTRFARRRVRFAFSAVPAGPGVALPLLGAARILAPSAAPRPPNVLLVSVDTLRADHLGTYGCELPTSPAIDALASAGTVFEDAVAPYPSTTASHMTMLTGVYPAVHGVRGPVTSLGAGIPTLAELLAAAGYETLAITEDGMLAAPSGFTRGFVRYQEFKRPGPADTPGFIREGVSLALDWLARAPDAPWFLFLHSYVVHGPFTPPPEYDLFRTHRVNGEEVPIGPGTPAPIHKRHLYAGEIRYADSQIARLLEGLAARGELDRTLVVLTADHGEAFDDRHGAVGHGRTVAQEVLHVPLVLRAPGLVPAGRRVAPPVSLADVVPTLLHLLGLPSSAHLQGRSLHPLLEHPDAPEFAQRLLFAETQLPSGARQVAVRRGRWKWIVGATRFAPERLYDIAQDPDEGHDLMGSSPLAAEGPRLAATYEAEAAAVRARLARSEAMPAVPDAETAQKLRALGYVE